MMDLDDLKAEISIEDVLLECGAELEPSHGYGWRSEVPFYCPFHLNRNTAAGTMNTMKGLFHCYSCGASGSVIDAAMLHLETKSVTEAAEWLQSEFLS